MLSRLTKNSIPIYLLCITGTAVFFSFSWNLSVYFFSAQKSSLCGCHTCLKEGNPWFRNLISASPEPFLSRRNETSKEVFNWWKRLQSEHRSFTFYNTTVENLFKIFPPIPDIIQPSPDFCRTCAVVGNSVNLKGSHYGPLIDVHDIVIRMNRGPTKGYESDVGTKTTHHVMYPESAVDLDNTTYLVLFPFKIQDLLWLLKKFGPGETGAVNSKRIANKDMVMILNPAFMKYVHEKWLGKKGKYPSTGFFTVVLSMHICDEISIFGFGPDRNGNWDHYFEKVKNSMLRTGVHPGIHEHALIQYLHKIQKIEFYKGW
ncbi:CMP-N-acetylneuraminate-beta-galactosamide-alpha-2,3-sialyltransferase 1-like [Anabas testudineus]|uniref:CMP-N-acetylneuraminate-beta-galactosamide-alpha-2,3-sialyltransferase 2 n=1 Tax=Anabas testudineus TaxID=64144 RepID=A0A3Q1JL13_ANATE|nr:CMP-N-acetylneuraminate-beta-galactosamide-alpha-2,3-sialyltransferase 1-like [Anabas testudineus]